VKLLLDQNIFRRLAAAKQVDALRLSTLRKIEVDTDQH